MMRAGIIAAAVALIAVFAYALCRAASDYEDPAGWEVDECTA